MKKCKTPHINHPAGNLLILSIPLVVRTTKTDNGERGDSDAVFVPSVHSKVKVEFSMGYDTVTLDAKTQGNRAIVEDVGSLGVGKYSVAVLCRDQYGHPLRLKKRTVVEIIDSVEDGVEYDTDEMDVLAKYPLIGGSSGTPLIVITDDAVKIFEGVGFYGEITEDAIKVYAREGLSGMEVTEDAVKTTIND